MRKKRDSMMKDVPLRAPAKGAGCGSLMRCSKRIQSLTSRSTSMNTAASLSGTDFPDPRPPLMSAKTVIRSES